MNQSAIVVLFMILVFLLAISVHEAAHAWTASMLGDPTARMLGRVSLNPLRHIDPWGTILVPAISLYYHFGFIGWARPTPVVARNFRNYKRDDILTTLAGPFSNLLLAVLALFVLAIIAWTNPLGRALVHAWGMYLPYALQLYRLPEMPFAETNSILYPVTLLLVLTIGVNLLLAVFNIIPLPPLDGSHIVRHLLRGRALELYDSLGMWGLVLFFLFGGWILGLLFNPLIFAFTRILVQL